jgi:hypothetical protein
LNFSSHKTSSDKSFYRNLLDSVLAMTLGFLFVIPLLWFCFFVMSWSAQNAFTDLIDYIDFIAIIYFLVGIPFDLFNRIRNKDGDKSI